MYYIVWKEEFTSYSIPQGNGYFVKYKDKLSDHYSKNWYDAYKYSSIGAALTRLRINTDMDNVEDFDKANVRRTKSGLRNSKIDTILNYDKSDIAQIISFYGRVDKIDENNEFLGSAEDEVVEFIKGKMKKNQKEQQVRISKMKKLGVDITVDDTDYSSEDYKNEFDNFFGI